MSFLSRKSSRHVTGAFAPLREAALAGAAMKKQRGLLVDGLFTHGLNEAQIAAAASYIAEGVVLFELGDAWSSSRIGGRPRMPRRHTWPRDRVGEPLSFVATLDLAELFAPPPLPETGTMLVFWSGDGTRVFWVPDGVPLADVDPPTGTRMIDGRSLTGVRMPILGSSEDLQLPEPVFDDLSEELGRNQLVGPPRGIAPSELPGEGWTFVGQLASGESTLYLVTPDSDVRTAQFDRTVGIIRRG